MTALRTCPECDAPTNHAYRPNLLEPGDIEPYEWCTTCSWDSDHVIAAAVCRHATTHDYCPQCGANRLEQ